MHKELGLLLLLAPLVFSQFVKDCPLTQAYIEKSKGTFMNKDVNGKNKLHRFPYINEGESVQLICNVGGILEAITIVCQSGSLDPLEPVPCKEPIEAVLRETDPDPYCRATMYSIGYEINKEFFELYRACYDKDKVQSHFSDVTVYWKNIYPVIRGKCPKFPLDGLILEDQAKSFLHKNIYEAFRELYDETQNYIKDDGSVKTELVINIGHLTARGEMLFIDQKIATFKYLNIVPQFKSINDGNWAKIEIWVQDHILPKSFVHVRTGALEVLSLPDFRKNRDLHEAFLIPKESKNPVPLWMYKIVRDANNKLTHAFLTYNNIYDTERPIPICCEIVPWPQKLEVIDSQVSGFSYCCEPEYFDKCIRTK